MFLTSLVPLTEVTGGNRNLFGLLVMAIQAIIGDGIEALACRGPQGHEPVLWLVLVPRCSSHEEAGRDWAGSLAGSY